jgi:hypothetical protein
VTTGYLELRKTKRKDGGVDVCVRGGTSSRVASRRAVALAAVRRCVVSPAARLLPFRRSLRGEAALCPRRPAYFSFPLTSTHPPASFPTTELT